MANLITAIAVSGCKKSDGSPCASGFVFLYSPGTTTISPGYRDDALTQPWPTTAGGIQLDAGGRASIWVAGRVDVVVTDASGTQVESLLGFNGTTANAVQVQNAGYTGAITDPATGAVTQGAGGLTDLDTVLSSLAASNGGTDGMYAESPGAVPRKIQVIIRAIQITPEDFGAAGNGLIDDTAAVQKCLTELVRLGRGRGYFAATYKISSLLTLPAGVAGLLLEGNGPGASIINQVTGATDCLSIGASSSCALRGLKFSGGGVNWTSAVAPIVDNVFVSGGTNGMGFGGTSGAPSSNVRVSNVNVQGTVNGILLTNANGVSVRDSTVQTTAAGSDQAFQLTGTTGNLYVADVAMAASTGFKFASGITGSNFVIVDNPALGGLPLPFDVSALSTDPRITQRGNLWDNITFAVAAASGTTNVFPDATASASTIKITTGGGTVFVEPLPLTPGLALDGRRVDFHLYSAGASNVTWTFHAIYQISAGVSGVTGSHTTIGLYWDNGTVSWREMFRAAT